MMVMAMMSKPPRCLGSLRHRRRWRPRWAHVVEGGPPGPPVDGAQRPQRARRVQPLVFVCKESNHFTSHIEQGRLTKIAKWESGFFRKLFSSIIKRINFSARIDLYTRKLLERIDSVFLGVVIDQALFTNSQLFKC